MAAVAPWKMKYIKILMWLRVEINEQTKAEPSCFRGTLPNLAGFVRMPHTAFSNLVVCRAINIYLLIYFAESHDRI